MGSESVGVELTIGPGEFGEMTKQTIRKCEKCSYRTFILTDHDLPCRRCGGLMKLLYKEVKENKKRK